MASFNSPQHFPLSGDNLPRVGPGYTESSGFRLLLFATKIHRGVEDGDRIERQCDWCGKYFFAEWGGAAFCPLFCSCLTVFLGESLIITVCLSFPICKLEDVAKWPMGKPSVAGVQRSKAPLLA